MLEKNTSAGSLCKSGEARLVGGSSTSAGILEICFDGSWKTVCKDSLDTRVAALICRQLGFLPIGKQDIPNTVGAAISGGKRSLPEMRAYALKREVIWQNFRWLGW